MVSNAAVDGRHRATNHHDRKIYVPRRPRTSSKDDSTAVASCIKKSQPMLRVEYL